MYVRYDDTRGGRYDERRYLRDQPVADRKQRIYAGSLAYGQSLLKGGYYEAAHDVYYRDEDAGYRVSPYELARAVHGAVEVSLESDFLSPAPRLFVSDEPGVQVRVNGHLLAGHRVQGEPGSDLGYAARALCDDDEVYDDEYREDYESHGVVAADDEVSERLYDLACRLRPLGAVEEDEPGRRHVEGEPEKGRDEEEHRECREVQRLLDIYGHEQDDYRRGHVERKEEVQRQRRARPGHHKKEAHHAP